MLSDLTKQISALGLLIAYWACQHFKKNPNLERLTGHICPNDEHLPKLNYFEET